MSSRKPHRDTPATEERERPDTPTAEDTPDSGASAPRYPLSFLGLSGKTKTLVDWLVVLAAVWLLITAVNAIGEGFSMAAGDGAAELFQFASNPFVGLVVGILATVLTQSSSTTTSITVALVAGGMPIDIAIPLLIGANLGTTMTSSLVSLGMARNPEMFRRGYAAATVHDMYNLTATVIFLPLELAFGFLEKASDWLATQLSGAGGGPVGAVFEALGDAVSFVTEPGVDLFVWIVSPLPDVAGGIVLLVAGVALILLVIGFIGTMLKSLLVGTAQRIFHRALGSGQFVGALTGTVITVLVQSSSTTTSLVVPLAGSGKFSLKQIFPFVVGSNIGTTVTALIAAFGFSGGEAKVALQAALVHLLFNLFGSILILGLPFLRAIPLKGADLLAKLGTRNKLYVVAWMLGVFIVLPLLLIFITAVI